MYLLSYNKTNFADEKLPGRFEALRMMLIFAFLRKSLRKSAAAAFCSSLNAAEVIRTDVLSEKRHKL